MNTSQPWDNFKPIGADYLGGLVQIVVSARGQQSVEDGNLLVVSAEIRLLTDKGLVHNKILSLGKFFIAGEILAPRWGFYEVPWRTRHTSFEDLTWGAAAEKALKWAGDNALHLVQIHHRKLAEEMEAGKLNRARALQRQKTLVDAGPWPGELLHAEEPDNA